MTNKQTPDPFGFSQAINWDAVEDNLDAVSEILDRME